MTEYDNVENEEVEQEVKFDYKNSFVSKNTDIINCTLSTCGRFKYSKEESMKEYGLTETQYEFYKSVKKEL